MVQRIRSPRRWAVRAVVLAGACLALLGVPGAAGQGALGISPTDMDFGVVGAGGVSVAGLTITNGADEARSVDVTVVDDDAGWFSVHRTEAGALSDAERLDLVILEPGGTATLHIRAAVAADAQPAVATASIQILERSDDRTVLLGAEVPVRVTVVGEAEVRGSIVSVDIPDALEGESIAFQVRVANGGTTSFEASIDAVVSPVGAPAAETASASSEAAVLLPSDEALVTVEVDAGLAAGDYTVALAAVVAGDPIATATAELTVTAQAAESDLDDLSDRSADNRGLILVGSVVLVLVMIGGAVLVARDEAGRHDGRPDDDDGTAPRPGEAEGRHTARTAEEAWPHRR